MESRVHRALLGSEDDHRAGNALVMAFNANGTWKEVTARYIEDV